MVRQISKMMMHSRITRTRADKIAIQAARTTELTKKFFALAPRVVMKRRLHETERQTAGFIPGVKTKMTIGKLERDAVQPLKRHESFQSYLTRTRRRKPSTRICD